MEQILKAPIIVTMFDESYNSAVKKGQMDLQGRFWNQERSQVDTHYCGCLWKIQFMLFKTPKRKYHPGS